MNLKFKICNFPPAGGLKICNFDRRSEGFTLLEVIIVMVIISTLIGIGTVSYMRAQKSGRDSQRQGDLNRLQSSLELYYSDNHAYPDLGNCSADSWVEATELKDYLLPPVGAGKRYLDTQPCDPLDDNDEAPCAGGDGAAYYYCQFNDSGCYCLVGDMEKEDNDRSEGDCGVTYTSGDVSDGYYFTCP